MTAATPAPILSDAPGSFAHGVFTERHPKLVERLLDALPFGPAERTAIRRLLAESISGVLEPLPETAGDYERWRRWGAGLYGTPWGEAPFLWAESFFYRKLLEATGYFASGAWRGVDPFASFKAAELTGAAVDDQLVALSARIDLPEQRRREVLLDSALWGNRADLGFRLTASTEATGSNRLLVDDGTALWSTLDGATDPTVALIADNAAGELVPDLALVDHLLTSGLAEQVVVWVKPCPYYVSDATMTDVVATIGFLRSSPHSAAALLGGRLHQLMGSGRLAIRTHDFFCAPMSFAQMPADLGADLATATLTVLKGDLNYRRLVGDLHWSPTTPFDRTTAHFPSPVIALRTLKSDVVVGLTAAQVAELDAGDPRWRTSGEHALVQADTAPRVG
ncbi:damage-control phosphatase ARMT1 family protein [Nocardia sp. NPDC052254]|uniref:damage-control phosphatase ARMT1 family protein n=1 Tax=Nocardia sp. NPDC052254 TaxID=3155681 RepID=UPI0034352CF9